MSKPNLLGKSKLDFLRPVAQDDSRESETRLALGEQSETSPSVVSDSALALPASETSVAKYASPDSSDELVKLTFLAPPDLAERLYAEVAYDPERRWMKDVLIEILREGLKHRPDPGKPPAIFIANLKSRGKRKKS